MTGKWDPGQYLEFADHRLRPAVELLARVPSDAVETVIDLGCGTGSARPFMMSRWPTVDYLGVDNSPDMLLRARADHPDASWLEADLNTWRPSSPVDLLYSNATLHWLPDHESLLAALMACLNPGGVLAAQMPANFDQPTHTIINDVARELDWTVDLEPNLFSDPVGRPGDYHQVLSPIAQTLDIWTTTYIQELSGPNAVTAWVSGSALRPILSVLPEPEARRFIAEYSERINRRYPRTTNGITLLPFTRLFMIASTPIG